MSGDELSVQLILDSSALAAYGVNETVGELLGELEEEDHLVAVSVGSLAQAVAGEANRALLALLVQRDSCVQINPLDDWEEIAKFLRLVGAEHDLHDASLVLTAIRHQAYILTDRPGNYTQIYKAVRCIPLEEPWADD